MAARPDAELVSAARGGDPAAFATLVERHRPALLRATRGSADAAQESVLQAPAAVPMRVTGVIAAEPLHIVLLEQSDGARRLPIWIPPAEGETLARRLREEDRPRPDTYRFAADLLGAAGGVLEAVRIVRLAESIFYAEAVLEGGASIDARPSDAINLALVTGAPILVDEAVLAEAAKDEAETAALLEEALQGPEDSPRA